MCRSDAGCLPASLECDHVAHLCAPEHMWQPDHGEKQDRNADDQGDNHQPQQPVPHVPALFFKFCDHGKQKVVAAS